MKFMNMTTLCLYESHHAHLIYSEMTRFYFNDLVINSIYISTHNLYHVLLKDILIVGPEEPVHRRNALVIIEIIFLYMT